MTIPAIAPPVREGVAELLEADDETPEELRLAESAEADGELDVDGAVMILVVVVLAPVVTRLEFWVELPRAPLDEPTSCSPSALSRSPYYTWNRTKLVLALNSGAQTVFFGRQACVVP